MRREMQTSPEENDDAACLGVGQGFPRALAARAAQQIDLGSSHWGPHASLLLLTLPSQQEKAMTCRD